MSGDINWSSVVFATHCDGANGSTSVTDAKGKSVTASGGAKISTAASKFGGASVYLDGGGDFLSIPNAQCSTDMAFGTGDFTIEMQIRPETPPYNPAFICGFGHASALATGITVRLTMAGFIGVGLNVDAATYVTSGHSSLIDGNFHHVAVCRAGNTVTTYIDGTARGSATFTGSLGATARDYLIGGDTLYGSNNYKGYIDEIRITKGVARYTGTFAAPTAQFDFSAPAYDGAGAILIPVTVNGIGRYKVVGNAAIAVPVSVAGSGVVVYKGVAAVSLASLRASGTGMHPFYADGDGVVPLSASGSGWFLVSGDGLAQLMFSGDGVGSFPITSQAIAKLVFRASGVGQVPPSGRGAAKVPLLGIAIGKLGVKGAASCQLKLRARGLS